jgi:limonene-1,2-epoxide hydrolase
MTDSPQSVVRRFLAAWEGWPNVDDIASFFADDAVFIDGPRGVHRGIAAIRSELEAEAAMGFRNLRADISSLVADGGTVMLERVDNFTIGGNRSRWKLWRRSRSATGVSSGGGSPTT